MEPNSEFLLASIQDIQSTIRAIDYKVSASLAGLLAPFAVIGKIHNTFVVLVMRAQYMGSISAIIFCLLWALTLFFLLLAIAPIDNPAKHIDGNNKARGSFYGGGLFSINFCDSFFNRKGTQSTISLFDYSKTFTNDESELFTELVFEQMKLVYIRDKKMIRFRFALLSAIGWLVVGVAVYLLTHSL